MQKKIKNLINKKNSDKKILSINKPSIKKDNYKQNKDNNTTAIPSEKGKTPKENSSKKPLLIRPLNKPESPKTNPNNPKNPYKPTIVSSSQSRSNLQTQPLNNKPSQDYNQDKKLISNNNKASNIKKPTKPLIQLIEKPKNLNKNFKSNESLKNVYNSPDNKQLLNKSNQNTNKPKPKK